MTGRRDGSRPPASTASRPARAGAVGGAGDEAGSAHRAAVALQMVVAALTDAPVPEALPAQMRPSDGCGPDQVPAAMRLETDDPVDDIAVNLVGGDRVLIQAKLSGRPNVLRAVLVEQWLPAVLDQRWQDRTALVLATECATKDLRTLGLAWRRRQDPSAGAPTITEQTVLGTWDKMLSEAIEQLAPGVRVKARSRLEAAVVLMVVEGRGPDSSGWQLQTARLANSVVPATQAPAAVHALTEAIRTSAQRRTGGTAHDWYQVLADAQLDLIARPDGVTAARVTAERAAVAEYRGRRARRLNRLALHPLGVSLSDVTVPRLASGLQVRDLDRTSETSIPHNLFGEIRGHRRALLLGQPGAGKSEALAQLAAFAADPSTARATDPSLKDTWPDLGSWAPLPLLVPLTRLLPHNRNDPIVITTDRLAALGGLLDHLNEDVTVLMSSRLSARSDAEPLRMDPLMLTSPQGLTAATSAVLEAFAAREPDPGVRSDWLQQRRHWLRTQQRGHHELFDIPLMAMLATVVAGQAAYPSRLPPGRARLVMAVLDLHIERWETRRHYDGRLEIASLDGPIAIAAMRETFNVLAHALTATGDVSWADAAAKVTQLLLDRYLSAPGPAERAADHILWGWQESAVLVLSDDDALRPRLRLFTEVGEALHAIGRPDELSAWVDARIDDEDRHPELLLAAELSPRVLTLLVERVEGTDPSDLPLLADRTTLAADALESCTATATATWGSPLEHGTVGADVVAVPRYHLTAVLLAALRTSTSPGNMSASTGMELASPRPALKGAAPRPAETDSHEIHGWAAWRLTELLIDHGPREVLISDGAPALAAALPPKLARLATASLWTRIVFDTRVDGDADLDAVDARRPSLPASAVAAWTELLVAGHTSPPRDPRRNALHPWMWRSEHAATLQTAAAVVLPDCPDLAPAVYRLREHRGQGQGHVDKLDTLLAREGHAALLADDRATQARQMTEITSRLATLDDGRPWLTALVELAAPAALSDPQRWHLAEIGALAWLYDLNGLQLNEHATILAEAAQAHGDLDRVAMTLLGVNPGVVAAQARQLLDAQAPGTRRSALMLPVYRAAAPLEVDWGRSADDGLDRDRLVEVLRIGYRMFAGSVCELLRYHPDQTGTARLLAGTLPGLCAEAQYRTAMYAGGIGGQQVTYTLAADEAPLVRAAAGGLVLDEGGDGGLERLRAFAADPDQSVRALTFGTTRNAMPRETRAAIRRWASIPPIQATCPHCGHRNEVVTSCENCSLVLPKVPHWFAGEQEPPLRCLRHAPRRRRRR